MKLLELLQKVKDGDLNREDLEAYRDQLCHLYADMKIESADLEKKEAIYYIQHKTEEKTAVTVKYEWKASPEGQRLILLKAYVSATAKVIDSLKSRIYSQIY